jgi:large subunit ribosomal protein L31
MRKDIHPGNYRLVAFKDLNNDQVFITRSTATTDETTNINGISYPLIKVHISSSSHPFFTGEERVLDIEGRVDKFKARAAAGKASREKRANAAKKQAKRQIEKATEAADKATS